MGPNASSKASASGQDKALADMIQGLRDETVSKGATALMDEDLGTFGVPNPVSCSYPVLAEHVPQLPCDP